MRQWMEATRLQSDSREYRSWLGIISLVLFAFFYCYSALISPFWGDNDTWSNLLPIIHYRHSILLQHTWPLHTDLWYGGRDQWANPLWSFLYLPSTIIWLIFPLDWGARIVFLGHLIFSLLAGRVLAGLFLKSEIERISAAIILTSPMLPALVAGHFEKVMSWGWILLALFFLLNRNLTSARRGLGAGICLGIVPLTGANYYTFYAAILLIPLTLSYRDLRLFYYFCIGSLIGSLHVLNVWQMAGHTRVNAKEYIERFSVNLWGSISALSIGFSKPLGWETWTPIGVLTLCLFVWLLAKKAAAFYKTKAAISAQETSLIISTAVLLLFATGTIYWNQTWFDLFRVPARALAFVALAVTIFVLINARALIELSVAKRDRLRFILVISAFQIVVSGWFIRPQGSVHSPYEVSVQHLAQVLTADHAKSVWISMRTLSDMYIHIGLTENNLALPNVYYGDMGQDIQLTGGYCGYSFDHAIAFAPIKKPMLELNADTEWSNAKWVISLDNLVLVEQVNVNDKLVNIYRVICSGK
jgi:hypothetical protein